MQRRFIFLINPRSGTQKADALLQLIKKRCDDAGFYFEIEHTRANGDYSQLCIKITHEAFTDIIICGGDGTISAVAACVRELNINIGIIPRGSGNGLALAAGISKDPNKALDIIFQNNPSAVDAFIINNQFSCMLSGIGFDAKVAHDFDGQQKRGFWKYAQLTLKNLFHIKTYPFSIVAKEHNLQTNAYFISIANSNQFGNRFTIAPKASLQDGKLDIVIIQKSNFFLLLVRVLWHIRFGTFTENFQKRNGIVYFQTAALQIENPSLAPFHVDGDGKATAAKFDVEIIPAAYRLLIP
jgi:YegS/Rv2252/BmrU family lipid kinase